MERSCRANQSSGLMDPVTSKTSKSLNVGAWDRLENEKRFLDALTDFMNQSWTVVCQLREKSGLNSQYEMSSTEIARRIDDVSKKLENKYKEVEALESQKAALLNKSPIAGPSGAGTAGPAAAISPKQRKIPADFQPVASSTPARQMGYSGNYNMSYSGGGSASYWPTTTASSGASSRRRLLYSGNSSGSPCSQSCQEYSQDSSGGYRNFEGVDYDF